MVDVVDGDDRGEREWVVTVRRRKMMPTFVVGSSSSRGIFSSYNSRVLSAAAAAAKNRSHFLFGFYMCFLTKTQNTFHLLS
jgi:hypothetical protein